MRQYTLFDQIVVQGFVKWRQALQDAAVELLVHKATPFGIEVEAGHRLVQDLAQSPRSEHQILGREGGSPRHHAHALTQQEQCEVVAGLAAGSHLLEQHGLVHGLGVDQGQLGKLQGGHLFLDLCDGPFRQGKQRLAQGLEECRFQLCAALMHAPLRLQQGSLNLVAARLIGTAKQLLFELVEQQLETPIAFVRAQVMQTGKQLGLPWRMAAGNQLIVESGVPADTTRCGCSLHRARESGQETSIL